MASSYNSYFHTNYLSRFHYEWCVKCSNRTICANYNHNNHKCKLDNSYRHIENCVPQYCGKFKLPLKTKLKMCFSILKGDLKFIK